MDIKTSMIAAAGLLIIAGVIIIAIKAYALSAGGNSRAAMTMLKDGVVITAFVMLGTGTGLSLGIIALFQATKVSH